MNEWMDVPKSEWIHVYSANQQKAALLLSYIRLTVLTMIIDNFVSWHNK